MSSYRELVNKYLPRRIRNEADYQRTLKQVQKLMIPRPTAAQSMLIEVLSTLIEQYEPPAPKVTPAKMLAHCIEARQITAAQLAKDTGIHHTTISNVLAQRRGISKTSAVKLANYFNLPASVFL